MCTTVRSMYSHTYMCFWKKNDWCEKNKLQNEATRTMRDPAVLQTLWLCAYCSGILWCCIDLRRFGNRPWSKDVPDMTGSQEEGVLTGENWFTNWKTYTYLFISHKRKLLEGWLFVCRGLLSERYGCNGRDDM